MATPGSIPLMSLPCSLYLASQPGSPILESTSSLPLKPLLYGDYPVTGHYDTLVFSNVSSGFVHRPEGRPNWVEAIASVPGEVPASVAEGSAAGNHHGDQSMSSFIAAVATTMINAGDKLVPQGDFTFDEVVYSSRARGQSRAHRGQLERVGERPGWNGTDQDATDISLLE